MLAESPSRDDPVAYVPWWLNELRECRSLFLVAWSDDAYRKTVLRAYARDFDATFLECISHRTGKQFLQWLASGCGLFAGRHTLADLYSALEDELLSRNYLVILDEAHLLSLNALGMIRALHHSIDDHCQYGHDGRSSTSTFVLSSGNQELVNRLDRVQDFWAYCCCRYHFGVPFSKKEQQQLDETRRGF